MSEKIDHPFFDPTPPSPREFLGRAARLYHRHFWLFVKLTAPAVILGYIAVVSSKQEGREIQRYLSSGPKILSYRIAFVEIWAARFVGYLVSWIVYCFSFGAVCIAVRELQSGATAGFEECFAPIRERLSPFFRLSLLLFVLLPVAGLVAAALATGIAWLLYQVDGHLSYITIRFVSVVSVGCAVLVLSRFSLAIPALVLDNFKVAQSMFKSDALTEGQWLILAALLTESVAGSYVAGLSPFWLAARLPVSVPLPFWYSWGLTALSGFGIALVQPNMFIGFALLYLEMKTYKQASLPIEK
jgi:hypothetical protein